MNNLQYKSFYYLAIAIINILLSIISTLKGKEDIQEYFIAYEKHINKSYEFYNQENNLVVEKKPENINKVMSSVELSPFCMKEKK